MARSHRERSSWRPRTDASLLTPRSSPVLPPPPPPSMMVDRLHALALHDPGAVSLSLFAVLREASQEGAAESRTAKLGDLVEAHGWALPDIARREGGLWLLSAATIDRLRGEAKTAGRSEMLRQPYETSPLLPLYAVAPSCVTSAATAEDALCAVGQLPTVEWPSVPPQDGLLPGKAQSLIGAGMACVLQGSGLFKAGVERWGSANFLSSQVQMLCHVLVAVKESKRFKYYR